jgi:hypothetical protein
MTCRSCKGEGFRGCFGAESVPFHRMSLLLEHAPSRRLGHFCMRRCGRSPAPRRRLNAEAIASADAAAACAAIGADIPGWRARADPVEARAAAADVRGIGACGAESQAASASTPTPGALTCAATADGSERTGVKAGAAVARVTQQVDAHPAAVGLPGRTCRRRRIGPRADAGPGDVGADTGEPNAVEAAGGGVLATAAFRIVDAWDTEGGADAAIAIGIAGLAAATAARAGLRALRAIAHALADLVLVTVADAAPAGATGLAGLSAGGWRDRCRADSVHACLTRRAGLATDPTMNRAGHQVGAVVAAVGRAGRALGSDARAVLTVGENAGVPRYRATDVAAGPAVLVIAAQVATQGGRPAILLIDRAIRPLADSAAALHTDEATLADGSAGPAVLHVRLQVDAITAAVGLTGRACPRLIRRADSLLAGEAGAHRVAGAAVVRI